MELIPCIICLKLSEAKNDKAIAKICDDCETGDLNNILKNLDYKKVEEIIGKNKKQLKLTKDGELI